MGSEVSSNFPVLQPINALGFARLQLGGATACAWSEAQCTFNDDVFKRN